MKFKTLLVPAFATLACMSSACSTGCNCEGNSGNGWYSVCYSNGDGADPIMASENIISRKVKVNSFSGIRSDGFIDVDYIADPSASSPEITVYAPDNVMDRIKVSTDGAVLKVGIKDHTAIKFKDSGNSSKMKVVVRYRNVSNLMTSGSGDLDISGNFDGQSDLEIKTSGSGDIDLKGNITLESLKIFTSGSGDVEFENGLLKCNKFTVRTSGSGDVEIKYVQADEIQASTNGSGDMTLSGNARSVALSSSGTGDINAYSLKALTGSAYASGTGDIKCNVAELASKASGMGEVENRR